MKMRKIYNLSDILLNAGGGWNIETTLSYIDEHNDTISIEYDHNATKYMFYKYYDWNLVTYEHNDTGYAALLNLWNEFIAINKERYNRMFKALDLNYNPIHNYDKDSVITTVQSGSIDHVLDTTQQLSYGIRKETVVAPTTSTTTSEGSYDTNGQLTDSMKVTASGGTGTTTHDDYVDNVTNGGTNTDEYDKTDTITERTMGNIGTTQTADMILNELRVRRTQLLHEIIHEFMCENGYLCVNSEY